MSGFFSNFISLESHDKAVSPNSTTLEYVQIICIVMFPGLDVYQDVSTLDRNRIPEQIYGTVTYAGLLLVEQAK